MSQRLFRDHPLAHPTNQPAHTSSGQHSPEVENPEQWEHVAEIVLNSNDLVVEAVQHLQLWEVTHILDATDGQSGRANVE
jgi:hypothetical protein